MAQLNTTNQMVREFARVLDQPAATKTFQAIEHTETVKAERFVVFVTENNRTERAINLGKRGGFVTMEAARAAATNATLSAKPTIIA